MSQFCIRASSHSLAFLLASTSCNVFDNGPRAFQLIGTGVRCLHPVLGWWICCSSALKPMFYAPSPSLGRRSVCLCHLFLTRPPSCSLLCWIFRGMLLVASYVEHCCTYEACLICSRSMYHQSCRQSSPIMAGHGCVMKPYANASILVKSRPQFVI